MSLLKLLEWLQSSQRTILSHLDFLELTLIPSKDNFDPQQLNPNYNSINWHFEYGNLLIHFRTNKLFVWHSMTKLFILKLDNKHNLTFINQKLKFKLAFLNCLSYMFPEIIKSHNSKFKAWKNWYKAHN